MDVLPLGLLGDAALRAAAIADREVVRMEGVRLDHLAQYLADVRDAYVAPLSPLPGDELLLRLGGAGTPEVLEFTVCEVAGALGLSQPAATGLCADVLDLTYRLRELAQCVRAGELPFVRARMIARRTRELSVEECALVEASLMRPRETGRGPMPVAALVPIGRLRAMVDQAALTVRGPETVAEAEARVAASLYVEVVHEAGGATDLAARLATADAARLDQRLDEIAGWLAQVGDERPKAIRRAVALGLLADPDLLAALADLRADRSDAPLAAGPDGDDTGLFREPTVLPLPDSAAPAAGERTERPESPGEVSEVGARHRRSRTLGGPAGITGVSAGIAGMPAGVLKKLAGITSTVLYVHMDRGSATWCEENAGVLSKQQAREIIGHSNVTVRPVLDLSEPLTYTGYEAPPRLKEQLALLNAGYCTFPHCHRRARPSDVDHQQTHRSGGATSSRNTHRLCRKHHRAKDKGRWRVVSPAPGFWIWSSPAGSVWLVTNGTTIPLNGIFARQRTAAPELVAAPASAADAASVSAGAPVPEAAAAPVPGAVPAPAPAPAAGGVPRWPGRIGRVGARDVGIPSGYPLTAEEYDVTYGFLDTS